MLAPHIVGARRQYTIGRPAQNDRDVIDRQQIVDVGKPGRELLDLRAGIELKTLVFKVMREASPVDRMAIACSAKVLTRRHGSFLRIE